MTTLASVYSRVVPAYVPPPKVVIQFRLLREGEVTPEKKTVYVFRSMDTVSQVCLALEALDGELTTSRRVDLSVLIANGDWLVIGNDETLPRKTRANYLDLSSAGLVTFNLTSGDGGDQGDPAELDCIVRVDRASATREVVLTERALDGSWRLAGFGVVPIEGGPIEAKVRGGALYALAVDDFGYAFAANLAVQVGQRIRPSVFAGVLYQVTEAGVLPASEPEWWPITSEGSRELGTARAEAVRYYRPLAHGPVTAELT